MEGEISLWKIGMKEHLFTVTALFFLLLAMTALSGCAAKNPEKTVRQGGEKLSGRQLVELLTGATLDMEEYSGKAKVTLHEDGKLSAVNRDNITSDGFWKVQNDELCLRFRKWGGGDAICYAIYQLDGRYLQFNGNVFHGSFDITAMGSGPPASSQAGGTISPPNSPEVPPEKTAGQQSAPAPSAEQPAAAHLHTRTDTRYILGKVAKDCPGCNLSGIDLSGADLEGANLQGANLLRTVLRRANLRRANLSGTNLYGADLRDANLFGADLSGANLADANLSGANLENTNLQGTNLSGAIGR